MEYFSYSFHHQRCNTGSRLLWIELVFDLLLLGSLGLALLLDRRDRLVELLLCHLLRAAVPDVN